MEGRHISLEPTQQIQTKVKVSGTPSHRTGTLFTAISAICYGATPILIKVQFAYGQPTSSTLSYRLFFSMIMIALLAVAGRFSLRVSRNDIVRFLYVGLAGAIGLLLLGAAPVSYTHLDVYKRQVHGKRDRSGRRDHRDLSVSVTVLFAE